MPVALVFEEQASYAGREVGLSYTLLLCNTS